MQPTLPQPQCSLAWPTISKIDRLPRRPTSANIVIVDDTPRVAAVEPPADGNHRPKRSKQATVGSAMERRHGNLLPSVLRPQSACPGPGHAACRRPRRAWRHGARERALRSCYDLARPMGARRQLRRSIRAVRFDSPAFVTGDTNGVLDLFVRDRFGGSTVRANRSTTGAAVATFPPFTARMSADGRYVAFESDAANVVPNDTNGAWDVFLRDLRAGTTELVSRSTNGQQYGFASTPAVSADGRYVAFGGPGAVYVRDRLTQVTSSRTGAFLQGSPLISGDGHWLVYRNYDRVVAYDRSTDHAQLINVILDGKLADPYSYPMDVSADGRYVLFVSNARNLVPNTADEERAFRSYVRDRQLQITERVSVSSDGTIDYLTPPHIPSSMSADGRYVAFASITRGIDNMAVYDVFRRDRLKNRTWIASVNSNGVLANNSSQSPLVSGDGHIVAFSTEATNLSAADPDAFPDAYAHEFAVPPAGLVLSPTSLSFGSVAVGANSPVKVVKVSNGGTSALTIQWVGLTGTNASAIQENPQVPGHVGSGCDLLRGGRIRANEPRGEVGEADRLDRKRRRQQIRGVERNGTVNPPCRGP